MEHVGNQLESAGNRMFGIEMIEAKTTGVRMFLLVLLTLASGLADSQGFLHASQIWQEHFMFKEMVKSGIGFLLGAIFYWFALKYLKGFGVISPEIQTICWFSVTIIGISLANGEILGWTRIDQFIAFCVVLGLGWLLFRTD